MPKNRNTNSAVIGTPLYLMLRGTRFTNDLSKKIEKLRNFAFAVLCSSQLCAHPDEFCK
jgi:hypothetical protein